MRPPLPPPQAQARQEQEDEYAKCIGRFFRLFGAICLSLFAIMLNVNTKHSNHQTMPFSATLPLSIDTENGERVIRDLEAFKGVIENLHIKIWWDTRTASVDTFSRLGHLIVSCPRLKRVAFTAGYFVKSQAYLALITICLSKSPKNVEVSVTETQYAAGEDPARPSRFDPEVGSWRTSYDSPSLEGTLPFKPQVYYPDDPGEGASLVAVVNLIRWLDKEVETLANKPMTQVLRTIVNKIPDEFIRLEDVNAWTDMGPSNRVIETCTRIVAYFDTIESDTSEANSYAREAIKRAHDEAVSFLDLIRALEDYMHHDIGKMDVMMPNFRDLIEDVLKDLSLLKRLVINVRTKWGSQLGR